MQPVHVTLREVVRIFCLRLGQDPIKTLFKQEQQDHMRHPFVLSAELVYGNLSRTSIKETMKGLVFKDALKGGKAGLWMEQVRWTYEGQKIKFLVTLRIYKDGTHKFFFSTIW